MEALFLNLLNMSITASWLCLAVIILRLLLKKAPKAWNVFLWALVALRLVFPFSAQSILSLIPSTETIPQNITTSPSPTIDSGINAINSAVNPIISQSFAPNPGDSVNPMQVITFAASVIWLIGLCIMLIYSFISYLHLRHKVKVSLQYEKNIFFCDNVDTPFILGVFNPKIYLPSGIDESAMEYVLQHENAHLKRKDHLWKPIGFILLSVYWFNPVLWLAYILLCRDIELACDEKVIKNFDSYEKKGYSEALVECSVHRRKIMACPLAFGEVGVKGRIRSVLNYKKPAFWIILTALILSVVLCVCFLTDPLREEDVNERLLAFLDVQIHEHYSPPQNPAHYQGMDFEIIGTEKKGNNITVYMWVLYTEYSYNNGLVSENGSHVLTAITAKKVNDYYELAEYWEPRDGSYYSDDVKAKIPLPLRIKAFNHAGYYSVQKPRIEKKALDYVSAIIYPTPLDNIKSFATGNALIYETPVLNGETPIINSTAVFDTQKFTQFLAALEKQDWHSFNDAKNESFYIDGSISYDTPIYFGLEQGVIICGTHYCKADNQVLSMLKQLLTNTTLFVGYKNANECTTVAQLKSKHPVFFSLDTSKGLSVYIWQMAANSYSCAIFEGKTTVIPAIKFTGMKSVSIREARLITDYYGLDRDSITVRPIAAPHSSYFHEMTKEYTQRLQDMFFSIPEKSITVDPQRTIDHILFDVDSDGIDENCYLTYGFTSGIFSFCIEILEEGKEYAYDYCQTFSGCHGDISFLKNDNGIRLKLVPSLSDDVLLFDIICNGGSLTLQADENNVKDKYGKTPIIPAAHLANTESKDMHLPLLKARAPQYFEISNIKSIEIYTWRTEKGAFYGILPSANDLKTFDEIKSMEPITYDELTVILSSYGLSEDEIKNIPVIRITLSANGYSLGFTDNSIDKLKAKFPQYFDLSKEKGLEVYVWQTGESSYYCGLLPGRELDYTRSVLQNLEPATISEMKLILESYGISKKYVSIIPFINFNSDYRYTVDNDYCQKIQKLFWDEYKVSPYHTAPDFDEW